MSEIVNIGNNVEKVAPYKSIRLISGVDRYGFSDILAAQIGINTPQRSFANWLHGWIWWESKDSTELMIDKNQRNWLRCVVGNNRQKDVLLSEGFKNVWAGGLPFAYTAPSNLSRNSGSLLAMPPHSDETEELKKPGLEYLDYLAAIKKDYSSVWVSVYFLNKNTKIIEQIRKRGLMFIDGARPDDANSLRRQRALFDSFEYVTSNTMGSHIIYAISCGCKTSLCGPMHKYDETSFANGLGKNKYSIKYVEDSLYYLSYEYLANNFSFLFGSDPRTGYSSKAYGLEQIGYYNKLNNQEILNILQWGWRNQLIGYYSGGVRRIKRLLSA